MAIQLFDASNIDRLPWPDNSYSQSVKSLLIPLIRNKPNYYIDNVETTLLALLVDDLVIPISINYAEYKNSYVCSPYGHFVEYCKDQIFGRSKKVLGPLIDFYGFFYKLCKFNRVVIVNNWLFSTNLYPALSHGQIAEIRDFLAKKFPKHAIIFRSINNYHSPELSHALKRAKFHFIPSRIVFISRSDEQKVYTSRMFKSDQAALKASPYEISPLNIEDSKRAAEIYSHLNIHKHSKLNPQFNAQFVQLAIENNFLTFKGLKRNGQLDGVVGYYSAGDVMTCPLYGYDTELTQELKLYRQLSTILLNESKKNSKIYNQSSGAGDFKKLRRAESVVESYAVYTKHLPVYQKAPWSFLKYAMKLFGLPIMKRVT
jgi:hypothetical protein